MEIENGKAAEELVNKGLIAAMKEAGKLFENGEYFVLKMLISARAMQSGMAILSPSKSPLGSKLFTSQKLALRKGLSITCRITF